MGDVGNVGSGDPSINYQYQVGGTDAAGKTAPVTAPPTQGVQDSMVPSTADPSGTLVAPNPIDAPVLPPTSVYTMDNTQLVSSANEWLNTINQSGMLEGIMDTARLMAAASFIEELFARDRSVAAFALSKLIGENIMQKAEIEIQQHFATAAIGLASAALAGLGALVSVGGAVASAKAAGAKRDAEIESKQAERLADKQAAADAQAGSSPITKDQVTQARKDAEAKHKAADDLDLHAQRASIAGKLMENFSRSFESIATNIMQAATKGAVAEKDQQKVLLEAILNIMRNSGDSATQSARSFNDLINSTLQMMNKWSDESARNFNIGRG